MMGMVNWILPGGKPDPRCARLGLGAGWCANLAPLGLLKPDGYSIRLARYMHKAKPHVPRQPTVTGPDTAALRMYPTPLPPLRGERALQRPAKGFQPLGLILCCFGGVVWGVSVWHRLYHAKSPPYDAPLKNYAFGIAASPPD